MALSSTIKNTFRIGYEVSPILLHNGIASETPGGILPIVAITSGLGITLNALNGDLNIESSAKFIPAPGTVLLEQDVPIYNQYSQIALANCTIKKPNTVNMTMYFPVQTNSGGYLGKNATMTALKVALDTHNQLGGYYSVLTPSYIYTGCLLKRISDQSQFSYTNLQVQYQWLFEFVQPIVLQSSFQAAFSNMLNKLSSGIQGDGLVSHVGSALKGGIEFPGIRGI